MGNTYTKDVREKIKQTRQSNFELLRIIAMLLIVAHHFSFHGGFDFSTDCITIPRMWVQFIAMGGKIGVSIFILISGYFLINAPVIQTSKIIKLWLQIFSYSLIIYLLVLIFGVDRFSVISLIKNLLPITFGMWWFASVYIVLYILTPFLNRFLKSLDKKTYQSLLLVILVMWCIIPTLTTKALESNILLWFMYLYSIAGYIRLWDTRPSSHCCVYHFMAIGLALLTFVAVVLFDIVGAKIPFVGAHATYLYGTQKLPILMISLLVFLGFKNLKIGYHKYINMIATSSFGIYLIHDNRYVREFLWVRFFKNANYADTALIIPYSMAVICVVFVICGCIELIRINVLERKYMKVVERIEPHWTEMMYRMRLLVVKFLSRF